jgi:hypothetical protein
LIFQNILSIHITLYYFEANLSKSDYEEIENFIKNLDFDFEIKI